MSKYLAKMRPLAPIILAMTALAIIAGDQNYPVNWRFDARIPAAAHEPQPLFQSRFVSTASDQFVHAASISALPDRALLSAWFGGSREGGRDVSIYGANYDPTSQQWGANRVLASRESTEQALHRTIRKLGNPVVSQAPDGKLWLFYVSVSVGGWAGSAINASYSLDQGHSWSPPKRLITSPFANISTLVKGTPIYYQDGSIGLPVYHEFLGKFAEMLRLDSNGRVFDKIRISHGKHSLQPVIVPADSNRAQALMRYAGAAPKRMLLSTTENGGTSWPVPHKASVANPNSALTAVRLADGDILAVMNDLDDGRHRISLMLSEDQGETWRSLIRLDGQDQWQLLPEAQYLPQLEKDFYASMGSHDSAKWESYRANLDERVCEDGNCRLIYDYPYMIHAPDGHYQLVYTWNKSFIKHLSFNQAWLDTL